MAAFWVDPAGSDGNPGTASAPFRTIQRGVDAAVGQNVLSNDAVVTVGPGKYRERVAFPPAAYTARRISIVATGAALDGSDVFTGWTPVQGGVHSHPWTPFPACACPYDPANCPPGVGMRREMVFVDGALLRQVDGVAAMTAGTFAVDDAAGRIYVWTPTGANPDAVTTEVAVRGNLFAAVGVGLQDLFVSGLTVQRSSDCPAVDAAVDIEGVPNVVLQDVSAVWNNDEGIFVTGATGLFQLTRVRADNNGYVGMGVHNTKNLLATDCTTKGNNWRGKWVGFAGWFTSGVKFGGLHDATLNGWASLDPFWFDTDVARVTVNDLFCGSITGDVASGGGVILEAVQGPVAFNRPKICQAAPDPVSGGLAFLAQAAQNVAINDGIVFLHNAAGTLVGTGVGVNDPADVVDWETGLHATVTTKGWSIRHTAVVVNGGGLNADFVIETDAVKPDFWKTLVADFNVYWDPLETRVWQDGPGAAADFAEYKAWLQPGQEANSVWANPFANDPTGDCAFVGVPGVWPR